MSTSRLRSVSARLSCDSTNLYRLLADFYAAVIGCVDQFDNWTEALLRYHTDKLEHHFDRIEQGAITMVPILGLPQPTHKRQLRKLPNTHTLTAAT